MTGKLVRNLVTFCRKLQIWPTYANWPVRGIVYTWTSGCTKASTISSWSESAATGFANSSTLKPSTLEDISSLAEPGG